MPRGNGDVRKVPRRRRIEFQVPIKAISTNQLYGGVKKRSWVYKKFRKQMFDHLSQIDKTGVQLSGNLTMHLEVGFSSPLNDLSNAIKGTEDVVAEWIGFNDRQIVSMKLDKYLVNKGDEYIKVAICKTTKQIDRRSKKNGKKI